MLEMCGGHSVSCPNRPAIVEQSDRRRAQIDHRLNRQRHSGPQLRSAAPFAVIGNLRLLMELAPHPVTNEFAHHRKPAPHSFIFDFGANVSQAHTLCRHTDRSLQRLFRDPQ